MIEQPYPNCRVTVERLDGFVFLHVDGQVQVCLRALAETLANWSPDSGVPRIKVEAWPT